MDGPIISFDISKNESHMRGFIGSGISLGKVVKINHDYEGYKEIEELYLKLRKETNLEPSMVYEFTGVYALPLLSYFLSRNYKIYQISPLESAKMRKAEIRPTKNDSLDTGTIAKVYYTRQLNEFKRQDQKYEDIKEMSRLYQYYTKLAIKEKNRFHRCLDAVWPLFDKVIAYDSEIALKTIIKYGHPTNIKNVNGVITTIKKSSVGTAGSKESVAKCIVEYTKNHNSGCLPDSFMVKETIEMAKRVQDIEDKKDELLKMMLSLMKDLPEFKILKSIPGVADKSAVRLLAEIGDINKYNSSSSFIAYIGLDPMVMQSGTQKGEHMHITKKGNSFLRATLYLIVTNMVRLSPDSTVSKYVLKKKNDGHCYKSAVIAGCNKLARIIFAILTNGTYYSQN